jgi:zinc protease
VNLYFAEIDKPREVPRVNVVEPPQKEEVRDVVYDNIQLPMVLLSYHIPEQTAEDYYAVEMLTKVLADGQSSRLYKELVDKEQIAYTSGAFTVPTEDPGLFIAWAYPTLE